jgi:hypothetical protein
MRFVLPHRLGKSSLKVVKDAAMVRQVLLNRLD